MIDVRELDGAIRRGLKGAGVAESRVPDLSACVLKELLPLVADGVAPTVGEVVEDVKANGDVELAADGGVLSDGRFVPPAVLSEALLALWRQARATPEVPVTGPVEPL